MCYRGHELRGSHVFLDSRGRERDPELEQYTADRGRTPESVVPSHLLNQGNRVGGQARNAAAIAQFELSEYAESFAAPAEHGLGPEGQQGLFAMGEARRQVEKPKAARAGETGFLQLAVGAMRCFMLMHSSHVSSSTRIKFPAGFARLLYPLNFVLMPPPVMSQRAAPFDWSCKN